MARSRNIKPAFFINDKLGELEPLARLLFIGMWTIADYKGDLENRPAKIKAQILPYDNCDVEILIASLVKSRFLITYSDGENSYLRIPKFKDHQNPHPHERKKGSTIPSLEDCDPQLIESKGVITSNDKKCNSKLIGIFTSI